MNVDVHPPIRTLSLCSGVGMLDLGVRLAVPGARTLCYVEREPSAVEVLVSRMRGGCLDEAPVWGDLREFMGDPWAGSVDLLVAGFPCQPFSTASRGRKVTEDLWPQVSRVIRECRPPWVFLENVLRGPIETAAQDLVELGYSSAFDPFDAAELGSGSRRRRWFLAAYDHHQEQPAIPFDDEVARLPGPREAPGWEEGPGGVLGMDDGPSGRMVRLTALGNGVVPVVAAFALRTLVESLGGQS